MKPLEKFLKKQTNALTRAGGFGEKATGTGASRRRASLSRVVPFFRETSPESGPAREVFSPETEEAPCWPSATADIRSPSLSSDEQSSEASLDTNWTPLPADTTENLALALLDSVAGKRYANCTGETSPILLCPCESKRPVYKALTFVSGCLQYLINVSMCYYGDRLWCIAVLYCVMGSSCLRYVILHFKLTFTNFNILIVIVFAMMVS